MQHTKLGGGGLWLEECSGENGGIIFQEMLPSGGACPTVDGGQAIGKRLRSILIYFPFLFFGYEVLLCCPG
jgi:hypothetical protein